ncbi:hypothetical protein D3C77_512460 [compost metagenome]
MALLPLPFWLMTAVWLVPNWPPALSPFQLLARTLLPSPLELTSRIWLSPVW